MIFLIPGILLLSSCATPATNVNTSLQQTTEQKVIHGPISRRLTPITHTQQTGTLNSPELVEVSGMVASIKTPGVLYAINDSGNSSTLYAISETGNLLGTWKLNVQNRDWEDMTSLVISGIPHLIIGDTGDNLKVHAHSTLHVFEEPDISRQHNTDLQTLSAKHSITFKFDDGPRNVEAFAVADNSVYLISKEPLTKNSSTPSGIYQLILPDKLGSDMLLATRVGVLPKLPRSLTSRLAASIAGVDLNHITAMDFDHQADTAYLLTYQHILKVEKHNDESWVQALAKSARRIHNHDLGQAEALAISPGRAIWFTSESRKAPLWALPIITRINN